MNLVKNLVINTATKVTIKKSLKFSLLTIVAALFLSACSNKSEHNILKNATFVKQETYQCSTQRVTAKYYVIKDKQWLELRFADNTQIMLVKPSHPEHAPYLARNYKWMSTAKNAILMDSRKDKNTVCIRWPGQ